MKSSFSFWEKDSFYSGFDSIVIGGGIVGLTTALTRKRIHPNEKILVLERGPLGLGGSTRNAGFACFGSPSEILSDLKSMPEATVVELIKKRWTGLQVLRELIGDDPLRYERVGGIELFSKNDQELEQHCHDELENLNGLVEHAIGIRPYSALAREDITKQYQFHGFTSGIINKEEGSIDTGKMFQSLLQKAQSAGISVMHGAVVAKVEYHGKTPVVQLENGTISCQKLFIATNGFTKELLPELDVHLARNLVLISEPGIVNWKGTFHMQEGYIYFRNVGSRLLIGGARHLDQGWKDSIDSPPPVVKEELHRIIREHLKGHDIPIEMEWTGYLGVGDSKSTILQRLSEHTAVGVRMGGMGVAIGSLIGKELATTLY